MMSTNFCPSGGLSAEPDSVLSLIFRKLKSPRTYTGGRLLPFCPSAQSSSAVVTVLT